MRPALRASVTGRSGDILRPVSRPQSDIAARGAASSPPSSITDDGVGPATAHYTVRAPTGTGGHARAIGRSSMGR